MCPLLSHVVVMLSDTTVRRVVRSTNMVFVVPSCQELRQEVRDIPAKNPVIKQGLGADVGLSVPILAGDHSVTTNLDPVVAKSSS